MKYDLNRMEWSKWDNVEKVPGRRDTLASSYCSESGRHGQCTTLG